MNKEETLIDNFYTAFNRLDYKTMQQCYHNEIVFSDPAFGELKGLRAKAMWHMLAEASNDLSVKVTNISANTDVGSCNWDAKYIFSRTGRPVHNKVKACFKFRDEKIISHTDSFNFWRWSAMALGTSGILLGWTPFVKNKVRATALSNLNKFITKHTEYHS